MTLGRATDDPGWNWSEHVSPSSGDRVVRHLGVVISGRAMVVMDDGREVVLRPEAAFEIGPGHDSWVVGDEPYVSLHLIGAAGYPHG